MINIFQRQNTFSKGRWQNGSTCVVVSGVVVVVWLSICSLSDLLTLGERGRETVRERQGERERGGRGVWETEGQCQRSKRLLLSTATPCWDFVCELDKGCMPSTLGFTVHADLISYTSDKSVQILYMLITQIISYCKNSFPCLICWHLLSVCLCFAHNLKPKSVLHCLALCVCPCTEGILVLMSYL